MKKKIVVVGNGRLGSCLVSRMTNSDLSQYVEVIAVGKTDDLSAALDGAAVIILTVKSYQLEAVAKAVDGKLVSAQLLISFVSGESSKLIRELFGVSSIVCATTNIGAKIGKGSTVCVAPFGLTEEHRQLANLLLQNWGKVYWQKDEAVLHVSVRATGCMPAINVVDLQQSINALVKEYGSSRDLVTNLVMDSWDTTVALLRRDMEHIEDEMEEIIETVATPRGVTEKILSHLDTPTVAGHKVQAFRRGLGFKRKRRK